MGARVRGPCSAWSGVEGLLPFLLGTGGIGRLQRERRQGVCVGRSDRQEFSRPQRRNDIARIAVRALTEQRLRFLGVSAPIQNER
jgi:hypothetical protein